MKSLKGNIFRDLQIFAAVAEFQNYSDAAAKLGIDISSVGRRIKSLEERLKHLLLVKDGRNIRITAEGMSLYQEFIQQEQAFCKMLAEFQDSKPIKHNCSINIVIPNGIIEYILSAKLPLYIRNNPEIKLNLICDNLNTNIIAEKYDFVILRNIPSQNQLVIKKLYELKFYLYCTPEYKRHYGLPQSLNELSSHLLIHRLYPNRSSSKYFYATNGTETYTLVNNSRLGTSSSTTDKNIVLSNHAIVSGTDILYKTELEQGTIIKVFPEYCFIDDFKAFYLIYDENRPPGIAVQNLIDFIVKAFEDSVL